jgi:phage gpG-like protein
MTAFDVTIRDSAAQAVLDQLAQRATNLRPALLEIGEDILAITKGAFATSTSPWGERWAPNTQATILAHLAKFSGSYSKRTGRITAAGSRRTIAKKPLIGETRSLVGDIYSRVDGNTLTVGSPMVYAAIHQFGGRAGRGKKVEIPARPFLPADDAGSLAPVAQAAVMEVLERYLN